MFIVVHRTDTLPEIRALVNTDHIVAVVPVSGGVKSRFALSSGEAWEVALPFTRAISLLHAELEIVEPVMPTDRRRDAAERPESMGEEPTPGGERRRGLDPGFVDRRRPPGAT